MTAFKKVNLPTVMPADQTRSERDIIKFINERDLNLAAILDRGIAFGDNVDCRLISFTSSDTPDAENTVAHGLGKTPTGFIVTSIDKAAIVYNGATAWDATDIYLKVDTATVTVSVLVF